MVDFSVSSTTLLIGSTERLLLGIARASQALTAHIELDQAVNTAIAALGEAIQVDRVYIFANHPHPATQAPAISQRWEWVGPGIASKLNNPALQNLLYADCLADWHTAFMQRQPIHGIVAQMPDLARNCLAAQGIQSILMVPIWDRDRFWGVIGFDDCQREREWSDLEITVVDSIAASIAGVIARDGFDQRLAQTARDHTTALQASEEKFRNFAENASDILTTWLLDSTINYISPYFETMTGWTIAERINQSFVPLVHPDDLDRCIAANMTVAQTGVAAPPVEFRLLHRNGQWLWVNIGVSPIKDQSGQVVALQGIIHNIHQQKQLEIQLREQIRLSDCRNMIFATLTQELMLQEKLHHCTEVLVDALDAAFVRIWTTSQDGTTLELQASSGLYTHIDGDHARVPIGQFKIGLIAEEKLPHLTNDVLNDPRVGNKTWAEQEGMIAFAGYPLIVGDDVLGVIALFARHPLADVTLEFLQSISHSISLTVHRDRAAAQLTTRTEELQETLTRLQQTQSHLIQSEKMSSLGEMVAGVAHEINNPVNFIHGNISHVRGYGQDLLELLDRYQQELPNPSPDLQAFLDDIDLPFLLTDFPKTLNSMKSGTERIREIVLTLRNFSRLDEAAVKEVDIHDGINSTLLILQNRIKSNADRPEIIIKQSYGDLPLVYCYASQLNQVFMNLLANAIDALEDYWEQLRQSGIPNYQPTIAIQTVITAHQTVMITFQDNGPGIPPEVKSRLFDPFFTTKPVGKGTGLGLSISYQIIADKHQGQLRCDSADGAGTTFTIELPLLEAPPES